MRPVRPSRSVVVARDHTWHPGHLEAWRRDGTRWRAFVRYSTGTGMQHLEWVSAERVITGLEARGDTPTADAMRAARA